MREKREKNKSYPLSVVQSTDLVQLMAVALHPQGANVPVSVYIEKDMDLDLLRRALDIEVQRNDSLRNRIRLTFSGIRQSFLPEKKLGEIPFDDLQGKTEEEFNEYVRANNARRLRIFRGETFRLRFFRAPDGRFGIHGIFAHLAMDAISVLLFYRDLFSVYVSLRDGKPLPPPMGRFEVTLQKDLAVFANKEKQARIAKFYEDYLSEGGPSFYAGVDGMRDLNRIRKLRRDPNCRTVPIIHPLNDRTKTLKFHVDETELAAMEEFCAQRRVSLQSLFQLGMRTHLSKVNEESEDVSLFVTVCRRATLEDINSGGSRALAHTVRTVFDRSVSFDKALFDINRCNLRLYRHADYSCLDEIYAQARREKHSLMDTSLPLLFTFFPKDALFTEHELDCEFFGSGTGRFVYGLYTMLIPNVRLGRRFAAPRKHDEGHQSGD